MIGKPISKKSNEHLFGKDSNYLKFLKTYLKRTMVINLVKTDKIAKVDLRFFIWKMLKLTVKE